jgi:hypothetical protein
MTPETSPSNPGGRLRLVDAAVKAWTGQLIDLGGRNTLLYYRDLKQGTLDLTPGAGASDVAVGALLGSRTVRLSELFDSATLPGAARRARTVQAKAAENFEERGLHTLFLAWGMATWTNPGTSPRMPPGSATPTPGSPTSSSTRPGSSGGTSLSANCSRRLRTSSGH